jgi:hypothetical protein
MTKRCLLRVTGGMLSFDREGHIARSYHMKKYLVVAALVVGFAAPAFAVETFYIMFDNSMKGQPHACQIMTTKPSGAKYKMMGEYKSKAEAESAMHSMKECG